MSYSINMSDLPVSEKEFDNLLSAIRVWIEEYGAEAPWRNPLDDDQVNDMYTFMQLKHGWQWKALENFANNNEGKQCYDPHWVEHHKLSFQEVHTNWLGPILSIILQETNTQEPIICDPQKFGFEDEYESSNFLLIGPNKWTFLEPSAIAAEPFSAMGEAIAEVSGKDYAIEMAKNFGETFGDTERLKP